MSRTPRYLGEVHNDALLAGLLALAQEVAVLRHRVAALEAGRDGATPPDPGAGAEPEVVSRLVDELVKATTGEAAR